MVSTPMATDGRGTLLHRIAPLVAVPVIESLAGLPSQLVPFHLLPEAVRHHERPLVWEVLHPAFFAATSPFQEV